MQTQTQGGKAKAERERDKRACGYANKSEEEAATSPCDTTTENVIIFRQIAKAVGFMN